MQLGTQTLKVKSPGLEFDRAITQRVGDWTMPGKLPLVTSDVGRIQASTVKAEVKSKSSFPSRICRKSSMPSNWSANVGVVGSDGPPDEPHPAGSARAARQTTM